MRGRVSEERRSATDPPQLRIYAIFRSRSVAAATIRKVGLWCSVAAVLALALPWITDNRNLGFGYHITREDQLGLLTVAITLCALQAALYRTAGGKEGNAERDQRDKRS